MKNQHYSYAAAILAGGKNSRMGGRNKAFLRIDNIPLIERTIDLLEMFFNEILIITDSVEKYAKYKKRCIIIKDKIKEIGPLGGIYSALSGTGQKAVFFTPCDMPFLHNEVIRQEISCFNKINCDAVVPRINRFIEPVHAIFKTELKNKLFDFIKLNKDHSIRNFLKTINIHYLDLEDNRFHRKVFKNINTINDWKRYTQK